ncbi:hypothetical protein B0H63DRAFT_527080 [Podospora didyma]|uniref:RRM domain-containing protein n=1 Tax=Podospora didyma TaxID=330526 RepID=A0AAE0K8P0_9PEZI|nr:hypothetical protein B0H63DRAFT_527080 [Podospora didyma]
MSASRSSKSGGPYVANNQPRDGRGTSRARSPTPVSEYSCSGGSQNGNAGHDSRGRSRTTKQHSLTPSRSVSRSLTRSPTRSRERSYSRGYDSRSPSRSRSRPQARSRSYEPTPAHKHTKVVVERLSKNVNADHVHEIFEKFGTIVDLDVPLNRSTGYNRGTAYLLFSDEAAAEAAVTHMHEAHLDGNIINVSIVLPRRKISPAPPIASHGANFDPRGPPPNPRRGGAAGGHPSTSRNTYRPRSADRLSRSRSPERSRSRSRSPVVDRSRSRSRSPGVNHRRYRSRSRSPAVGSRRHRSRSRSYSRSSSYTPPPTRGGRGGRGNRRGRGGGRDRRRSPSYDSYDSYDRRSRSRSRTPRRSRG